MKKGTRPEDCMSSRSSPIVSTLSLSGRVSMSVPFPVFIYLCTSVYSLFHSPPRNKTTARSPEASKCSTRRRRTRSKLVHTIYLTSFHRSLCTPPPSDGYFPETTPRRHARLHQTRPDYTIRGHSTNSAHVECCCAPVLSLPWSGKDANCIKLNLNLHTS